MIIEKKMGLYMGTEVNEKWWRRYRKDKLFLKGNGQWWFDEEGFYFHRFLTSEPIFFPYHKIREIKLGKWHSGSWGAGKLVIKILWKKHDLLLSSGFLVSRKNDVALQVKEELISRMGS